ncbi:MAG: hypothetical protein KQI35_07515 [Bacteroidetes bacterium]|nr:hypothetical protein [Bacteroidota bacterium]
MKKTTLLLGIIAIAISLSAQKVALHSSSGIQHFNGSNAFVEAYNASTNGDTIYLPGGGFTSPSTIDKSLFVIGAGHYPDSTVATAKTFINGNIILSDNADGFRLEGVDINGSISFDNNEAVNNVIIKYCNISNDLNVAGNLSNPSYNLTIINSVFASGYFYLSNAQNAGIFNSIIQGRILNSYGNLFENNILMWTYTGVSGYYTLNGDNNVCNNNIFLNAGNKSFSGVSNQIYNNLFVTTPSMGTTPIASGNYYPVAQSSIFISQSGYIFDYTHNYHLQDPGTYLGVDNTEIGLYGGTLGYKEGAVPSNPHFQNQNIAPTTNTSGLLNIQVSAAAQDN